MKARKRVSLDCLGIRRGRGEQRIENGEHDTTLHIIFPSSCACSSSYLQDVHHIEQHPPFQNSSPPFPSLPPSRNPYLMAPVVAPSPIEALPNPLTFRSHRTLPNLFSRLPRQKPSHPPLSPRPFDSTPRAINGAYATFISKDDYLPGALVLAYCHHMTRSIYPFIILATPSLSQKARAIIKKLGINLIDIETLVPAREQYDPSVTDTRFRETWTKLR